MRAGLRCLHEDPRAPMQARWAHGLQSCNFCVHSTCEELYLQGNTAAEDCFTGRAASRMQSKACWSPVGMWNLRQRVEVVGLQ